MMMTSIAIQIAMDVMIDNMAIGIGTTISARIGMIEMQIDMIAVKSVNLG